MPNDAEEIEGEVIEGKAVVIDDEGDNDNGAEEELTVQIGDDAPEPEEEAKAPQWVRDLRKRARELERENRQLKEGKTEKPKLGEKPKRSDPGIDYDDELYDAALAKWYEDKREHEAAEASAEEARKRQDERWQRKLSGYDESKAKLGVSDFDEAEDTVRELLSPGFNGMGVVEDLRLNIIKQGAKDPSLVIYALGKNTKRAKELAEIDDPVEFAMAVGRLEAELKVTRRPASQPERTGVDGAGTGAGSVDNTLERLRAKAEKTGDYSEVFAYKRRSKAA